MDQALDTILPSIGNPGIESGMVLGLNPSISMPGPLRDNLQQILTERRTFEDSRTHSPTTQESDQLIFGSLGLEDFNNVQWENSIASGPPPVHPSIHPQVPGSIPLPSNILPPLAVPFPQPQSASPPYFGADPFVAASSNVPYSESYPYPYSTHPSFFSG